MLASAETQLGDCRKLLASLPDEVGDMNYMKLDIAEARLEGEIKVLQERIERVNHALTESAEMGNGNE